MKKVLISENILTDIADAIRAKSGTQKHYHPSEMAAAINALNVVESAEAESEESENDQTEA